MGVIGERHGEETEMLTYPAGILVVGAQHRQELRDEPQRWRLIRAARRGRRRWHAAIRDATADRIDHAATPDAQPNAASRGRIAGWVAAGGRGRVDIASSPPTNTGAGFGPRSRGSGG